MRENHFGQTADAAIAAVEGSAAEIDGNEVAGGQHLAHERGGDADGRAEGQGNNAQRRQHPLGGGDFMFQQPRLTEHSVSVVVKRVVAHFVALGNDGSHQMRVNGCPPSDNEKSGRNVIFPQQFQQPRGW